jgi:hypothetical protein
MGVRSPGNVDKCGSILNGDRHHLRRGVGFEPRRVVRSGKAHGLAQRRGFRVRAEMVPVPIFLSSAMAQAPSAADPSPTDTPPPSSNSNCCGSPFLQLADPNSVCRHSPGNVQRLRGRSRKPRLDPLSCTPGPIVGIGRDSGIASVWPSSYRANASAKSSRIDLGIRWISRLQA